MSVFALALLLASQPAATAAPQAAPPKRAADKVKCKRELETGSLVKQRKECRTVAEWDQIRRDSQDAGEQLRSAFRPAGPQ